MAPSRRDVLAAGAAAAGTLAGCAAPSMPTDAWPVAGHDARRTGYNPLAPGPSTGRRRWVRRTGTGVSSPVVSDGSVYVVSDGVYAFGTDGARLWRRPLHFDTRSSPAVLDGTVYATNAFALYALRSGSGRDRWTGSSAVWHHHAPVADGGTLYVAATKARFSTDFDARVIALDRDDGGERWRAPVGSNVLPPFSPAVADGSVYAGRDRVYALDAATGEERWTFDAPDVSAYGDPAVADGTVHVPGLRPTGGVPGGALLAIDAATGEERWRFETDLRLASPAVADGSVYVTSDRVYALDAATGGERWRHGSNRYLTAAPSVAGGRVYLGGVGGAVTALSAADGSTEWRLATGGSMLTSPAVVGRTAYVASADRRVIAVGGA